MTTTPARWEAPEVVDPPTFDGIRRRYYRLREVTGLRSSGWVTVVCGVASLVLGLVLVRVLVLEPELVLVVQQASVLQFQL